jgi:hypothetical protein
MQSGLGGRVLELVGDELHVEDALVDDVVAAHLSERALQGVAGGLVALQVEPEPQHDHSLLACV